MHAIAQENRRVSSTVVSAAISVGVVCRYVSAAFWTGVLVGVVPACLCVASAHQFLGLEYGFHSKGMDRSRMRLVNKFIPIQSLAHVGRATCEKIYKKHY
jgi:hypothetical protein